MDQSGKLKWLIGVSFSVVSFVLATFVIIPFVVDLNKFKLQIQEAVGQQINAKLDFSSARLTIFSGLGIELKDVSVENTDPAFAGTVLFKVKALKFSVELLPLFKKQLIGSLIAESPNVLVVYQGKQNNIKALIKLHPILQSSRKTPAIVSPSSVETLKINEGDSLAHHLSIQSLEIKNATMVFSEKTENNRSSEQETFSINHLDLYVSNIGLGRDMLATLKTRINLKNKDFTIEGPLTVNLIANTAVDQNSRWSQSSFQGKIIGDDLLVNYKDILQKKENIPFSLDFQGSIYPNSLDVKTFGLKFLSFVINGNASIFDFKKMNSHLEFSAMSQNISDLESVFPKFKKMLFNASLNLTGKVDGTFSDPLRLKTDLMMKSRFLGSDIELGIKTGSFKPLAASFTVRSQVLNVTAIASPFFTSSFPEIDLTNLSLVGRINNQILSVEHIGFHSLSGSVLAAGTARLSSLPAVYQGNLALKNIKVEKLIHLIKPDLVQIPLEGKTDLDLTFNGAGFSAKDLSKNLDAEGIFLIHEGVLKGKSLLLLASEKLSQFLGKETFSKNSFNSKVFSTFKIPSFADDGTRSLSNLKGNFEIKKGRLIVKSFWKGRAGAFNTDATIGLDQTLDGQVFYTASEEIKQKILMQNKSFIYLFNSKGDFELPMTLSGTFTSPEVNIETDKLEQQIIGNIKKEGLNKLKDQIQKNSQVQKLENEAKKALEKNGINLNRFGL